MHFALCGLHLLNEPLNYQLRDRNAKLVKATKTVPKYTMHALSSTGSPTKPGLIYHPLGGPHCKEIFVEIWDVPEEGIGSFLALVPSPLAFGTVFLKDNEKVYGFVCEAWAAEKEAAASMGLVTEDITIFGGWREWELSRKKGDS